MKVSQEIFWSVFVLASRGTAGRARGKNKSVPVIVGVEVGARQQCGAPAERFGAKTAQQEELSPSHSAKRARVRTGTDRR